MAFYTRIHGEHWLFDKLEEGRIVILEDDSIWEVHPSDWQITKHWLRISTITVKDTETEAIRMSCRTAPRERMPGHSECNGEWLLKDSISQNWSKKLCARKPYKRPFAFS